MGALNDAFDAVQDKEVQVQGGLDRAASAARDNDVRDADDYLKRYNRANNLIKKTPMGAKCAVCEQAYKSGQTIDNLKRDPGTGESELGLSMKGGVDVGAGATAEIEHSYKANTVSGTYYYIDSNNQWIKVEASHAKKGVGVADKATGEESLNFGVVAGAKMSASESAELPANTGLERP